MWELVDNEIVIHLRFERYNLQRKHGGKKSRGR